MDQPLHGCPQVYLSYGLYVDAPCAIDVTVAWPYVIVNPYSYP